MRAFLVSVAGIGLLWATGQPIFASPQSAPSSTSHPAPESSYSPLANPAAVVTVGHARFTVLTPQLIRMEWAADGRFEDHASFVFVNRLLPVPKFTTARDGDRITIHTEALQLTYNATATPDGKFSPKDLAIAFMLDGKQISWHPGMADTGNLQGTTRTLDGALGDKTREPIGPGLISRDGWVLVDDSTRPLFDSDDFRFQDGEKSAWPWVQLRQAGERQDLYFFGYGHDYKQSLSDYVRVAGRIPLPPRFAFGVWWSRYWAYSDQELDDLVRGFHENDVPLDVLVIDMDWHLNQVQLEAMHQTDQSGHNLGWSGYTWNPLLFPDPKTFLTHIHQEGLKATLNLHPASGVQPWEAAYPAMAKAMDIDPASGNYVPFDITNKKFATNYMDLLHHPLEHQGIDFWWLDWQQEPSTKIEGVSPTWWLNYVHFTDQEREGKRPLLFHRWGGLGNHRYEIGFSGDTISAWPSLAFQPWFTSTAANVGYAYWSHDIGGHIPGVVEPEMYTRWIQFGAFSPILRTHTTKNPDAERRIWAYPEPYSSIMRDTMHLRYELQPYIYTEARRTYDTGLAFVHPLYYEWPAADAAYSHKGEYAFGTQMVVAPVTQAVAADSQLAQQSIWIPPGEWLELPTGRHFTGPAEQQRNFSIEQVPAYVRSGAIIPMQPTMDHTDAKPIDPLIVEVAPLTAGQISEYALYADGSSSEDYKRGSYTWTHLKARQDRETLAMDVSPVEDSYPGMIENRAYELRLPADWPPASVTVNGVRLGFSAQPETKPGWHYEGNTLTTVILTPRFSVHTAVHISVTRAPGSLASRQSLDGFSGSITRLRNAYDALNQVRPYAQPPNSLIDAWQTGDRLGYRPETARAELARFPKLFAAALADVNTLVTTPNPRVEKALKDPGAAAATKARVEQYQPTLCRAQTLLEDGKPQ